MPDLFEQRRRIGHVTSSTGDGVWSTLPEAAHHPSAHHGERLVFGQVGQFVVIQTTGRPAFGRITEVKTVERSDQQLENRASGSRLPAEAHVQLLSSLRSDGRGARGILDQPRIGDVVFLARPETLQDVIEPDRDSSHPRLPLGVLSDPSRAPVTMTVSSLFGRHCAIFGATGSGKSWTVAHLLEELQLLNGKAILIDATGEFHELTRGVQHCSVGTGRDKPEKRVVAALPHAAVAEDGIMAFLRPTASAQLPRLREAIRSLRLAHVIKGTEDGTRWLDEHGCIQKENKDRSAFNRLMSSHTKAIEDPHGPFDFGRLAHQVAYECVYLSGRAPNAHLFGGRDENAIGYCSSLMLRIVDTMNDPHVSEILLPTKDTPSVLTVIDEFVAGEENLLRISVRSLPFARNLREIVVDTIGRHLLGKARDDVFRDAPLIVFIDEAHQFFGKVVGDEFTAVELDSWEVIAKEGRKYGLTTCMATQRPRDIPAPVVSQVGTHVVHRLSDGRDREYVESASTELDRGAARLLPGLVEGEALLVGVDFPVPISVLMTPPAKRPESEGPKYHHWADAPTPSGAARPAG